MASLSLWQGLTLTERAERNLATVPGLKQGAATQLKDGCSPEFPGRNRDDSNWVAGGRYLDQLERRKGKWKIAFRSNVIEWSGMLPTAPIPFAEVEDLHLNGCSSRSKSDPSYWRPLTNKRAIRTPQ